jgi:hypothetical protein
MMLVSWPSGSHQGMIRLPITASEGLAMTEWDFWIISRTFFATRLNPSTERRSFHHRLTRYASIFAELPMNLARFNS